MYIYIQIDTQIDRYKTTRLESEPIGKVINVINSSQKKFIKEIFQL